MKSVAEYWKTAATEWEQKRYDSFLKSVLFNSLENRRNFLAYVIDQLPEGSRVIELGCGSGRVYEKVKNKHRLNYVGYDISSDAIREARRKFPDTEWICSDIESLAENRSADLVCSAGLLDWLNDEQIKLLQNKIRAPFFIHSFSLKKNDLNTQLHLLFAGLLRFSKKINYSPRKFELQKIKELFHNDSNLQIVQNPDLSFGAFLHNFDKKLNASFSLFKTQKYFREKSKIGLVESFVKSAESVQLLKHLQIKKTDSLLEIGSGKGFYTKELIKRAAHVTACDPFVNTAEHVSIGNFKFYHEGFDKITFERKFNSIVMFGVLEFIEDKNTFLQKLTAVAETGTSVYLLYPDVDRALLPAYRYFHRKNGNIFTAEAVSKVTEIFEQHKFTLSEKHNCGPLNNLLVFKYHA